MTYARQLSCLFASFSAALNPFRSTTTTADKKVEDETFDHLWFNRLAGCVEFLKIYVTLVQDAEQKECVETQDDTRSEVDWPRVKGLFRIPGAAEKVDELKEVLRGVNTSEQVVTLLEEKLGFDVKEWVQDVNRTTDFMNVVASLIKAILADLPFPLFEYFAATETLQGASMNQMSNKGNREASQELLKVILVSLVSQLDVAPLKNVDVSKAELAELWINALGSLFELMAKVAETEAFGMPSKNMALVLIPSLCNARSGGSTLGENPTLTKELRHFMSLASSSTLNSHVNKTKLATQPISRLEAGIRCGEMIKTDVFTNQRTWSQFFEQALSYTEDVDLAMESLFDSLNVYDAGESGSEQNEAADEEGVSEADMSSVEESSVEPVNRRVNIANSSAISDEFSWLMSTPRMNNLLLLLSQDSTEADNSDSVKTLLSELNEDELVKARKIYEYVGVDFPELEDEAAVAAPVSVDVCVQYEQQEENKASKGGKDDQQLLEPAVFEVKKVEVSMASEF